MEPKSPFSLSTRPCEIDLGRFRWEIRDGDSLFQSSAESFETEDQAMAEGKLELERLTQPAP
jgi:hypothetical protein